MQIRARGRLTVYEARGQYQLSVQQVEPAGAGMLQAKFEALKRKLQAEGLFESARKRALPQFPGVVALVTSPSGAALRDMLNIFTRRAPWLRLIIVPARVQGDGSAEEIVAGLQLANDWERLVEVARGFVQRIRDLGPRMRAERTLDDELVEDMDKAGLFPFFRQSAGPGRVSAAGRRSGRP